jgi:BMFP domain-containing protein YqiC
MHHVGAKVRLMQEKFDVESLVRRLTEDLPASVRAFRTDIEAHAGRVLKDATRRLDLVSREEFDAQTRVLARSRELITELEQRIAVLEQKQREDGR